MMQADNNVTKTSLHKKVEKKRKKAVFTGRETASLF
jgi:hypothetical protein